MDDANTPTKDTPETRDALRFEALPMVLAIELVRQQDCLQPEELISHDELEEAVQDQLGLELSENRAHVYIEISSLMCEWNWQWLTYDSGLQHFYARPEKRQPTLVRLTGNRHILLPDHVFPNDVSDVFRALEQVDPPLPFLDESDDSRYWISAEDLPEDKSVVAFLNAHKLKPLEVDGPI